ncbi:Uncharacterised protein [Yersinia enterocolitica]|nr:Uncharacterised protein [Yersinia enterocolitica]
MQKGNLELNYRIRYCSKAFWRAASLANRFLRESQGSGQSHTFSIPKAPMPPQLPCKVLRFTI